MKNAVYFQVFFVKILRKLDLKVANFDSECEAELRATRFVLIFSMVNRREESRQIHF